ncbi:MAG: PAS domain S-box protein, partial [Candidatus Latescibacteria bacterium]|nr:PAS domain S-box protein [Candidatus Latescibacterota bacterium]
MSAPAPSLPPTLARLSFWVPSARLSEFELTYETRLAPILKRHGLVASSARGRPAVESVFSRLFALSSPAAVAEKRAALQEDPGYQQVVYELRRAFSADPQWQEIQQRLASPTAENEYLAGRFDLYSAPAGPGKQTKAGPGKRQAAGRGRGLWRTFDAVDGFRGGYIRSILQDPEGVLWIGSYGGGLCRYDGQQFKTYTASDGLPTWAVQSIVLARDGTLWIGTHGEGIYRYDGQRFEHLGTAQGLVDNYVLRLFEDREGNLWIGTWRGLSRWDGRAFASFTTQDGLPTNEIHAIYQDREDHLWFGVGSLADGNPGGACRYDGHHFTAFAAADGLAARNAVLSIAQDREGNLWFGTAGGVSRYDHREFTTFTTADGLAANEVTAILQDREANLWFTTKHGGVSRYDGQHFATFTTADGLGSNSLEAVFEDREGALWFGTWSGLSRYEVQTFTTFTTQDGLPDDQVLSVCQDREGALWFGTAGAGLCRWDGHTATALTTEDGLPDNRVFRLFQDREGVFWFAVRAASSGQGICRYDGQTLTTFTAEDGLPDEHVGAIFQDREGIFWFGAGQYDGQTFCSCPLTDGLTSSTWISYSMPISAMAQDQAGVFWFSTEGRGVIRHDGHSSTTFTTHHGLAGNTVHSMIQDREGGLWFATHGGGVSQYDGKRFKTFTTQEGLAEDVVLSLAQDRRGRIWIGTLSGGVSCFDGQVFQTLNVRDGLASNEIRAIFEDRDGDFWFCTSGGVTRYRPPVPSTPPIFIDAVVADRRYERQLEVAVPVGARLIAFEFHGISLKTRPEAMVYRYRLLGHDETWRNSHARRVEYQDLPPGEYTFQVQAVDRDLNYSGIAAVRLQVVPDPRDTHIDALEARVRERTRDIAIRLAIEQVRTTGLQLQDEAGWHLVARCFDRELSRLIPYWTCSIQLVDAAAARFVRYAATGGEPAPANQPGPLSHPLTADLRAVVETGRPRYCRNRAEIESSGAAVDPQVCSAVDAPFSGGILTLTSREEQAFNLADIEMLMRFADAMGEVCGRFAMLQALKYSERRYADILSAVSDAIVVTDREHRIVLFNQAAERIFACAAQDMFGKEIHELLPERFRSAHINQVSRFSTSAEAVRHLGAERVLRGRRADGQEFPVEVTIARLESQDNTFLTAVVRDITDRERTQQELVRTQRLRAAGELSAGICHNLNNLLTAVLGPAELLQGTGDAKIQLLAGMILEAGTRAAELVHRLHL